MPRVIASAPGAKVEVGTDPRAQLATSAGGLFGKVTGRVAVAEAPAGEAYDRLINRTLVPRAEQDPGEVRARLEREYGRQERAPVFSTSFVQRVFGAPWSERNRGEHGVIGLHTADTTTGMAPPDIYAGPVWRRQLPVEWSQGLVRD